MVHTTSLKKRELAFVGLRQAGWGEEGGMLAYVHLLVSVTKRKITLLTFNSVSL